MYYKNQLYALCEGGPPIAINLTTLETQSKYTFNQQLKSAFSSHPKQDPETKEIFNLGISFGINCELYLMKINSTDNSLFTKPIPFPEDLLAFIHDFAITEKYMIIPVSPYYVSQWDLIKSVMGFNTVGNSFKWYNNSNSHFIIVEKDTLDIKSVIEVPPFSAYHVCNAYDNIDGSVSVFIARHKGPREALENTFRNILHSEFTQNMQCEMVKYDLDINSNTCTTSKVVASDAKGMEFAVINDVFLGRNFRYIYSPAVSAPGYFNHYQKIDLLTEKSIFYDLPAGCYGNEAFFVPKKHKAETNKDVASPCNEDVGYLLTCIYNSNSHCSEMLILDATDLSYVGSAKLPHHVPYSFHTLFVENTT